MINSCFKYTPWRSNKHAKWMAMQPCPICYAQGQYVECGYQGHHEGFGFGEKPTGGKYSDIQRLPLCPQHHEERERFQGKWYAFYLGYNVDPVKVWARLVNDYLVYRNIK